MVEFFDSNDEFKPYKRDYSVLINAIILPTVIGLILLLTGTLK